MPQTTGPFQFPMWGRPSPLLIPAARNTGMRDLAAGVARAVDIYLTVKQREVEQKRWEKQTGLEEEKIGLQKRQVALGEARARPKPQPVPISVEGKTVGFFSPGTGSMINLPKEFIASTYKINEYTDEKGRVTQVAIDKTTGKEVWRSDRGKIGRAGKTGTTITQQISKEKFGIQQDLLMIQTRTDLLNNRGDRNYFDANAPLFNERNKRNEVAYWSVRKWRPDQTEIVRLTPAAIKAGWTPQKVMEAAAAKGKTVEDVLRDIGVIK